MTKTILAALVATIAATGLAQAQDAAEGENTKQRGGMRQEMMKQIRGEGLDQAQFASLLEERAGKRFERLDADSDGMISQEEFMANLDTRAERRFARMDRNDDGKLTSDDRPFRGGRRGARADQAAEPEQQDTTE